MTKSWVSGSKSTETIDKLRQEVSDLEARRDVLVEHSKRKVFDWADFVFNSTKVPQTTLELRNHILSDDVRDVMTRYESLNHEIMEKQVMLNEKLDEQVKFDSLG